MSHTSHECDGVNFVSDSRREELAYHGDTQVTSNKEYGQDSPASKMNRIYRCSASIVLRGNISGCRTLYSIYFETSHDVICVRYITNSTAVRLWGLSSMVERETAQIVV